MEAEICACVSRLAATLKPEYAEALQAIPEKFFKHLFGN